MVNINVGDELQLRTTKAYYAKCTVTHIDSNGIGVSYITVTQHGDQKVNRDNVPKREIKSLKIRR